METNRVKQSDVHITYEYYDTSIKGPNDRRIHTIRWVEQLPDKALTPVSPEELKVLEDPNAGIPNGS